MTGDPDDVRKDFGTVVNMKAAELKRWLDTEESKSVGWSGGARKSTAVAVNPSGTRWAAT
jgi:hypothetical protein